MKIKKILSEQVNKRTEQLFRVLAYKIQQGQLEPIEIAGYEVTGPDSASESDFKEILGTPNLRKDFWDTYGSKMSAVKMIPENIVTLADFEKYYDLDSATTSNLTTADKAKYEILKAKGYEKVALETNVCPTEVGYDYQLFKDKNGSNVFCMRKKLRNWDETYPKANDEPFYCVKNQKYYNGKFPVRNTMLPNTIADRIQIDDTIYFVFMDTDGNAKLRDTQNRDRLTGTWKCKDDYSYKVVFPAFTKKDAQGRTISFVGMTIDYGAETKIIKH